MVSQAESDPELAVETGIRVDLPLSCVTNCCAMRRKRSETRLSRAPPHLFEEIRNSIAAVWPAWIAKWPGSRDFTAAKRFVGN